MTTRTFALAALASVSLVTPTSARGLQTPPKAAAAQMAPAKLAWPAAVEAAFKKQYPNAVVKNVAKETDGGQTTYEVESVDAGRRRDLVYAPDGSVVDYEEELKESDVPAVVLTAVKTRYPKATITAYWHLFTTKDHSVNFELDLKGAGSVAEVALTPEGKWVSPKAGK